LVVVAHEILRVINWTQDLDRIFKSNYEQDPSLSWQYFGSSSGIMRQYPGVYRCFAVLCHISLILYNILENSVKNKLRLNDCDV
jgi:hypothetical protein